MEPFRILVLFHPDSEACRALALDVYRRFMVSAGRPGLRIPVQFGPVRGDRMPPEDVVHHDATQRTLVVVLVDRRMSRRVLPEDRPVADHWGQLLVGLLTGSAHGALRSVLPVAVDSGAFALDERLAERSFVRLDVVPAAEARRLELDFQIAVAALQLIQHGHAVTEPQKTAPITLFLSHAKADTTHEGELTAGPIEELLGYLAQNPVEGWFDRKKIPRGLRFDEAIEEGVIACNAVVCVLTDHWSDREWCRREVLYAKRTGRPLVVVDAVAERTERLFPYIGNAPMLRWRTGASRLVVLTALLEALRQCHASAVLERRKRDGDHVLGTTPESLTLRRVPLSSQRVLYPDPPLPREELEAVAPVFAVDDHGVARSVALTTPLSDLAKWDRPAAMELIGLSVSTSDDIEKWGASVEHLGTLTDDLTTMLLLAGLRLGYGGVIDHAAVNNDTINYARRLFGQVRSYSPLARDLGAARIHPIVNFVSWPKFLAYGDDELALYGQEAELVRGPKPALNIEDAALGANARGYFPLTTLVQRWAYARGLTAMRHAMAQQAHARIAVGGKLTGYTGILPGVLEEILIACSLSRPVYLIGGFGGATRFAVDLIEQRSRVETSPDWFRGDAAALADEYVRRGDTFMSWQEAVALLQALGKSGPAVALDNGLDDRQNRELFESTDSYRIVELILVGLRNRFATVG